VSHVGFFRQVFKTPPAVGHKKRSIFVFLHFCNLQLFFFRGFFRCPASAQRVRAGRQGLELTYTPLKMPLLQMQFLFYRCICTKIGFLIWRDFLSKYLLAARLYMVHPHPIFVFIFCSTPAQLRFALYIQLLYVPFLLNFFAQKEWRCPGFFTHTQGPHIRIVGVLFFAFALCFVLFSGTFAYCKTPFNTLFPGIYLWKACCLAFSVYTNPFFFNIRDPKHSNSSNFVRRDSLNQ